MSDAYWTELASESEGRAFTRLLGPMESCFYWDGQLGGTADITEHHEIALTSPTLHLHDATLDEARFRAVWTATKQRLPLLAARVEETHGGDRLAFIVSEQRINTIIPGEFEYVARATEGHTRATIERGVNGIPRRLSRDLPVALTVLRRSDTEYDLIITIAHVMFDAISAFVLLHTLCDLISRWPHSLDSPPPDLASSLALVPSCDSLHARLDVSPARLRWKRAIGAVILRQRLASLEGGQTLPNKRTQATPHTPAKSRVVRAWLDPANTRTAVRTCRAHKVTLGHVLPVVAQLATSRLLRRRLDAGLISKEEWESRRRTPTRTTGPLNLRPYLEPTWKAVAGHNTLLTTVGTWNAKLPFLPDAGVHGSYSKALTPARFWLRARGVRQEVEAYLRHPLLLEMNRAMLPARLAFVRSSAEALRYKDADRNTDQLEPEPGQVDHKPAVFLHSGSSIGDIDLYCPYSFPVRPLNSPQPVEETLRRIRSRNYLRCRPTELYLGVASMQGELQIFVYFDANVYEEADIEEWMGEVKDAMMCYLCEENKVSIGEEVRALL